MLVSGRVPPPHEINEETWTLLVGEHVEIPQRPWIRRIWFILLSCRVFLVNNPPNAWNCFAKKHRPGNLFANLIGINGCSFLNRRPNGKVKTSKFLLFFFFILSSCFSALVFCLTKFVENKRTFGHWICLNLWTSTISEFASMSHEIRKWIIHEPCGIFSTPVINPKKWCGTTSHVVGEMTIRRKLNSVIAATLTVSRWQS